MSTSAAGRVVFLGSSGSSGSSQSALLELRSADIDVVQAQSAQVAGTLLSQAAVLVIDLALGAHEALIRAACVAKVRVLVLSTKRVEEARRTALRAGAHDYVVGPWHLSDVIERVRLLLVRARQLTSLVLPACRVDLDACLVNKGEEVLTLTATEARLLAHLALRAGETVAVQELLSEVWGYAPETNTRTVPVTIARLRMKIEADPSKPAAIRTVRGRGYRFEPMATPAVVVDPVPARAPLPAQPNAFVGRVEALASLERAHRKGERRWTTLIGPPGAGKTRLLLRAGERIAAGGTEVWYANLEAALTTDDLLGAVARAGGVQLADGSRAAAVLREAVRGRTELVLLLDNLEGIAEKVGPLVRSWLDHAPGLRVIGASRRAMGAPFEHLVDLPPMERESATTLFVERARQAGWTGVLDQADLNEIGILVEALDGLPLAVELAAARLPILGLHRLSTGLQERFRLLASREAPAGARHKTLWTAIEGAWAPLEPQAQSVLAQCSVFRSTFSLDAIEAVVTVADPSCWVVDVVHTLRDHSLLRVVGPGRFRLLHSIRDFAASQGDHPGLEERHLAWCAAQAGCGIQAVLDGDASPALLRLHDQAADLSAAHERALELGLHDEAVGLAVALALLQHRHGPHGPTVDRLSATLDRVSSDHPARFTLLRERGLAQLAQGADEAGAADLEAALAQGGKEDERTCERVALMHLRLGHVGSVKASIEGALRTATTARGRGVALRLASEYAYQEGQIGVAHERAQQALEALRKAGPRSEELGALYCTLALLHKGVDPAARAAALAKASEQAARAGDVRLQIRVELAMANQCIADPEQLAAAAQHYGRAGELSRRAGLVSWVLARDGYALVLFEQHRLDEAVGVVQELLEDPAAQERVRAYLRVHMGVFERARGNLDRAAEVLRTAHAGMGNRRVLRRFCELHLAATLADLGRLDHARALLDASADDDATARLAAVARCHLLRALGEAPGLPKQAPGESSEVVWMRRLFRAQGARVVAARVG